MQVNLTYFKRTGKYYTDGSFDIREDASLSEIWDLVRLMKISGELPGLVKGATEFIISIDVPDHPHNHPHLIL